MPYYEVWSSGAAGGNAIHGTTDATEMARLIRELLGLGWTADALLLSVEVDGPALSTEAMLGWLAGVPA